jgi:hypothetical protein
MTLDQLIEQVRAERTKAADQLSTLDAALDALTKATAVTAFESLQAPERSPLSTQVITPPHSEIDNLERFNTGRSRLKSKSRERVALVRIIRCRSHVGQTVLNCHRPSLRNCCSRRRRRKKIEEW